MKKIRTMKKIIIIIMLLMPVVVFSQELNCRVAVNHSQVKTTNIQVFQSLQRDISEFMNQTRWTNYVFNNHERIECSILITIVQFDGVSNFKGTIQVTSSRPVFDASLTTSVFKFREPDGSFNFEYIENQPIEYNENTYTSELSSVLAFYAYLILGSDFDTFSELGGTEFFDKAQNIVTNAQSSSYPAWKSMGSTKENNRYFLIKFLTAPNFRPYRQAQYKYHRLGLDVMTSDVTAGRQAVSEAVELLKQVYQKKPDNILTFNWLDAKRPEVIQIYSDAPQTEIKRVAQVLKLIDITHSDQYDKMGGRK